MDSLFIQLPVCLSMTLNLIFIARTVQIQRYFLVRRPPCRNLLADAPIVTWCNTK
jgi:hypothetical protein